MRKPHKTFAAVRESVIHERVDLVRDGFEVLCREQDNVRGLCGFRI